jgi:lysophospholipase L1-like esterase
MRRSARLSAVTPLLLACACGGGGGPTGPDGTTPRHPVALTVFYDENGDGVAAATENARVPDVAVEIAGQSGTSAKVTGETTVPNVPDGHHTVGLRSMPPYYRLSGTAPAVDVPQSVPGAVALTLPIGGNRANRYLGFGDSITDGLGSHDIDGYRGPLQEALQRHFGRGAVEVDGLGGSKSDDGAERIHGVINRVRPAYTLILYGTNDWKRCEQQVPCYTVDALRSMIGAAKSIQSLPILGTIPPVNPNENLPERNDWIVRMNVAVRAMAQQEGVPVADVHGGFTRAAGTGGELAALFVDTVHPNDRGYLIIADAFFRAITAQPQATTSSTLRTLFRLPPR